MGVLCGWIGGWVRLGGRRGGFGNLSASTKSETEHRVKITQECEYNIVSTLSYSTLELQLVISNY